MTTGELLSQANAAMYQAKKHTMGSHLDGLLLKRPFEKIWSLKR
jgi:hypothetical protein